MLNVHRGAVHNVHLSYHGLFTTRISSVSKKENGYMSVALLPSFSHRLPEVRCLFDKCSLPRLNLLYGGIQLRDQTSLPLKQSSVPPNPRKESPTCSFFKWNIQYDTSQRLVTGSCFTLKLEPANIPHPCTTLRKRLARIFNSIEWPQPEMNLSKGYAVISTLVETSAIYSDIAWSKTTSS